MFLFAPTRSCDIVSWYAFFCCCFKCKARLIDIERLSQCKLPPIAGWGRCIWVSVRLCASPHREPLLVPTGISTSTRWQLAGRNGESSRGFWGSQLTFKVKACQLASLSRTFSCSRIYCEQTKNKKPAAQRKSLHPNISSCPRIHYVPV